MEHVAGKTKLKASEDMLHVNISSSLIQDMMEELQVLEAKDLLTAEHEINNL